MLSRGITSRPLVRFACRRRRRCHHCHRRKTACTRECMFCTCIVACCGLSRLRFSRRRRRRRRRGRWWWWCTRAFLNRRTFASRDLASENRRFREIVINWRGILRCKCRENMSSRFHATSFPERFNNSINRTLDKNAVHSAGVTAPFARTCGAIQLFASYRL